MTRASDDEPGNRPGRAEAPAARRQAQVDRLTLLGEVVRALAHESRNALQQGQACLSLLRLRLKERPELLALIDEAEASQERLARIHAQVREFAQPPALRLQPASLDEIVRGVWSQMATAAGRRLELAVHAGSTQCRVDAAAMGVALGAVLGNAADASPAGSTVWVEIAEACIDGQPALSLTVRDEGPGVPDALRQRVFELFYTTRPGHAGLGLARARKLIECHGGQLDLLDAPDGGARFRLVLLRDC